MNAYELADELQKLDARLHLINLFKSANMLRQQADRIAELEKELKRTKFAWNLAENEIERLVRQTKQLAFKTTKGAVAYCDLEYAKSQGWEALQNIAQTKPLSDADIQQISHRYHYTYNPDYVGFARAIEERHGIK